MPLQITYKPIFSSVPYPASYWVCTDFRFNAKNNSASLQFEGWTTQADNQAGLDAIPGANKIYVIEAAAVASFNTNTPVPTKTNAINFSNIESLAEAYAVNTADVQTGEDGQGNPIFASFFANAVVVASATN